MHISQRSPSQKYQNERLKLSAMAIIPYARTRARVRRNRHCAGEEVHNRAESETRSSSWKSDTARNPPKTMAGNRGDLVTCTCTCSSSLIAPKRSRSSSYVHRRMHSRRRNPSVNRVDRHLHSSIVRGLSRSRKEARLAGRVRLSVSIGSRSPDVW
jgi:hypothetical protein